LQAEVKQLLEEHMTTMKAELQDMLKSLKVSEARPAPVRHPYDHVFRISFKDLTS
jgi:hypothetical protein